MRFGHLVIGPPGSGKSTYCNGMHQFMSALGRKVVILNLDPANDRLPYEPDIDISDLVMVRNVMKEFDLGPNGALLYAVQFMLKNVDWIIEKIDRLESGTFVLIDCPGQVELFTHDESMRGIVAALLKRDLQLACVNLLDSFHCRNIFHFLSGVLISLSSMLRLELPHVNVLSKIDLVETMGQLPVDLEYYLDLTRISYLLETEYDLDVPESQKSMLQKLAEGISEVVEEFSLVSFVPLDIMKKESVFDVLKCVDKAVGYLVGEENDRLKMMAMTSALQDDILDEKYKEIEKGLKESEESGEGEEKEGWEHMKE